MLRGRVVLWLSNVALRVGLFALLLAGFLSVRALRFLDEAQRDL